MQRKQKYGRKRKSKNPSAVTISKPNEIPEHHKKPFSRVVDEVLKNEKGTPDEPRERRVKSTRLRYCPHCGKTFDRDVNAGKNIAEITRLSYEEIPRPDEFNRPKK